MKSETLIPITRPYMPEKTKFLEKASSLWDTRWLTHGGPLVQEFEKRLSERLKVSNTVVFSNGHMALDSALKALDLKDGEAITTPFTYISTSHAISMNGLKPVFCDIKESDCTMDEGKIEALITEKTKVIVPVHVYGFPCNVDAIQKIADKHGLKVVYDAAHAFGVEIAGTGIGTFGDASMFSFHATKVFHTVEGGAVTFTDNSLRDKLVSAKNFGMVGPEAATSISYNAKMTDMHAAMGLVNLEILREQIEKRKTLVARYLEGLSEVDEIRLFQWNHADTIYNYAYFPIVIKDCSQITRDELVEKLLKEYNIQARKYFYPLLNDLDCYTSDNCRGDTPIARWFSNHVITLPLYVDLTVQQVDYICESIQEILARR